jgi:hypothetical protein
MDCYTIIHDSVPFVGISASEKHRLGHYGNFFYVDLDGKYIPHIITPVSASAHIPLYGASYTVLHAGIGQDGESLVGVDRKCHSGILVYWHVYTQTHLGGIARSAGRRYSHILSQTGDNYLDLLLTFTVGGYVRITFDSSAHLTLDYKDCKINLYRS